MRLDDRTRLPVIRRVACLLMLLSCSQAQSSLAADSIVRNDALPKEAIWQSGSACGPNVLYCMLRMKGMPVEYQELMVFLSPPEEGNSLEELRLASVRWGLPLKSYKTTRKGFDDLRTPFIAHTEEQGRRHYVLVTGTSDGGVELFDPETAARSTMPSDEFFRMWTGYRIGDGTRWIDRILYLVIVLEMTGVVAILFMIAKDRSVLGILPHHRRDHRRGSMNAAWKSIMFPILGAALGGGAFVYRQTAERRPNEQSYSLLLGTNSQSSAVCHAHGRPARLHQQGRSAQDPSTRRAALDGRQDKSSAPRPPTLGNGRRLQT